jgi:DNA (cytosine-5)-methyltransferase 1
MENTITFGSVCSGVEAASMAWEPLGWSADWFAELDKFPSAVLAHHWPNVPNLGDMTEIRGKVLIDKVAAPDILVGGTPCQAYSVAGKRASLEDERGQLTLSYVRLLDAIDSVRHVRGDKPAICVWENVPGVLNTKDNAFGCFLGDLAGEDCALEPAGKKWTNAGYVLGRKRKIAWRVLDAQYFGVAQRRRRVFVVASARDGFDPREVLFEPGGLQRNIKPSRETKQDATTIVRTGFTASSFGAYKEGCGTLRASGGDSGGGSETLIVEPVANCLQTTMNDSTRADGFNMVVHGTQDPCVSKDVAFCLGRNSGQENVLLHNLRVRKLTPVEGERLQGFPENHTNIVYGRPKDSDQICPDGHRYKAIGNSMAVPVMRWIGERIDKQINL